MIREAISAAVEKVSDKSDSVKQDIKQHLSENVLTGERAEGVAEQIHKMITELGTQFERMSLADSQIASYLLENLDLPRNNLSFVDVTDLVYIANEADKSEDTTAVIPSKLGFSELPSNGVAVQREKPEEDSKILNTVIYVKLNKSKMMLFVLGAGIGAYSVTPAKDVLVVERQVGLDVPKFGAMLEAIKDTGFAPPLMADREAVDVDDLDTDWLTGYVNDHPEIFDDERALDPRGLIDVVVRAYVDINGLEVSDKRINLVHHDALMEAASQISAGMAKDKENNVEQSLVAHDTIDDVEVTPVEEVADVDTSLFSEGVAEQTEKTVAPLIDDNLFGTEEVAVSESSVDLAIGLFNQFKDKPQIGLDLIQNTNLSVKDSLYLDVLNTLPSIEKRTAISYTDSEKAEIRAALDNIYPEVLGVIEKYRVALEKERIENQTYSEDMVLTAISENQVHNSKILDVAVRTEMATVIARYLNDNEGYDVPDPFKRIDEVLRNLSLYNYELESMINATYRATNVPAIGSLIRGTPVFTTTLRTLYKPAKPWNVDESAILAKTFNEVVNNTLSGLDLSESVVALLTSGKLKEKEFAQVEGFVVAAVPVKAEDTMCVVVMNSAQANTYNIKISSKRVVGTILTDKPSHRGELLNLLTYK